MKMPPAQVRNARPATRPLLEPLESRQLMSVGPIDPEGGVRIQTSLGPITFQFTPDATPATVANFLRYIRQGRYENTIIHRAIPGFVLQAGGYELANGFPHIDTFPPVVNEFEGAQAAAEAEGRSKVNVRGTLAMAKLGNNANSATSEFFISLSDNASNLDNQNGGFTTFAKVVGNGMTVADAIAGLPIVSGLNSAFTDVPVLGGSAGNAPVVFSSFDVRRVLPVAIDSTHRFVTWTDASGVTSTLTLSRGRADLSFVGGSDMKATVRGNHITITGSDVSVGDIVTRNTNKSSVLSVTPVSGTQPTYLNAITVATGSLGRIAAPNVHLLGDITAENGTISSIELIHADGSNISVEGGPVDVKLGTATDVALEVNRGPLRSLRVGSWVKVNTGRATIDANRIDLIDVGGDFTADINTRKDIGRVDVDGNIGGSGATSTWVVGGNLKELEARRVALLTLTAAAGNINSFKVTDILVDPETGNGVSIRARNIRFLSARHVVNATINATKSIGTIEIAGTLDSGTIRATNRIDAVLVRGNVSGRTVVPSTLNPTVGVLKQTVIFAGVTGTFPNEMVRLSGSFTNKDSSIGRVTVEGQFSNASIAAATVGTLWLGKVKKNNGKVDFGVTADKRIEGITATFNKLKLAVPLATNQSRLDQYFANAEITQKDLGDFHVQIV